MESAGRILVGQRPAGSTYAGKAEFPGGRCEADETPRSCAVRECREETGLLVVPREHLATVQQSGPEGEMELHFWRCGLAPQLPDLASPVSPFRWITYDQLRQLSFPEANRSVLSLLLSAG